MECIYTFGLLAIYIFIALVQCINTYIDLECFENQQKTSTMLKMFEKNWICHNLCNVDAEIYEYICLFAKLKFCTKVFFPAKMHDQEEYENSLDIMFQLINCS